MSKFSPGTKVQVNPKYRRMKEYRTMLVNSSSWHYASFSGKTMTIIVDHYKDGYASVKETCMRFSESLLVEVPDVSSI